MEDSKDTEGEFAGAAAVTYKLKLEGDGVTVNREIPETVALEILAAVMGGSPTPRAGRVPARGGSAGRGPSLREHFDDVEPKRNPDKILAIAYFLKEQRGVDSFSPDDIKREFKGAGEPVPGNWARDWRWTIQNGWIAADSEDPESFWVTGKGEKAVEEKFSADVKKATAVKTRSRRKAKKVEGS